MKRNKLGKNVGNLAIRQVGKGFICVYGKDSHDEGNSMRRNVATAARSW